MQSRADWSDNLRVCEEEEALQSRAEQNGATVGAVLKKIIHCQVGALAGWVTELSRIERQLEGEAGRRGGARQDAADYMIMWSN